MIERELSFPPVHEPIGRTLLRTAGIALAVGGLIALGKHDVRLWTPAALVALWFSLGGHYLEIVFLNRLRPRVPRAARVQRAARFCVWFCGGAVLYVGMAMTARALDALRLPLSLWWLGGLVFIGVELLAHAALALRRLPNFYAGDG